MAEIAKDTPKYILVMLDAVDYSKITAEHYKEWQAIIRENIGKHLKKRTKPAQLLTVSYPINQAFCDLINEYDFNSMPFAKQLTAVAMAKHWANKNLPLKRKLGTK